MRGGAVLLAVACGRGGRSDVLAGRRTALIGAVGRAAVGVAVAGLVD